MPDLAVRQVVEVRVEPPALEQGAVAQEESIARSSGLVACLRERWFYDFHREQADGMHSDYAIHSPAVPVFRLDSGELLDEPWCVSLITCAAANAKTVERYTPERLGEIPAALAVRTRKVLSLAAHHRHRQLVLGAWGCGAFGIDTALMAGIFHEALSTDFQGVFERVVFAITDWSPERRFSGVFEEAFSRA